MSHKWISTEYGHKRHVGPAKAYMIMLHGSHIDDITGAGQAHIQMLNDQAQCLYDYCDENQIEILLPESGSFASPDGTVMQSWDWSGYYQHGQDLQNILNLFKKLDRKKVWLHGGSGGGIMGWHVAQVLERMNLRDAIHGLMLGEVISPYCIDVARNYPPNLKHITPNEIFNFSGFTYCNTYDNTIKLGMANSVTNWAKQTLIQYSVNDPIIPQHWKEDFIYTLQSKATALTVAQNGEGHDTGTAGWETMVDWMKLKN